MAKKGYYEYDPVIYPRKLWVMPQATEAEIRMCFTEHDGEEIKWDDKECYATTFPEVCAKADGKYGVLVVFKGKANMTMGNICHEASHVLDDFMDVLPLARECRDITSICLTCCNGLAIALTGRGSDRASLWRLRLRKARRIRRIGQMSRIGRDRDCYKPTQRLTIWITDEFM